MRVYLNRYGLVAFTVDTSITLDEAASKLGLRIDATDALTLNDAVRCEEDRIGVHKNCLLLSSEDNLQFFNEPSSDLTLRLMRMIPDGRGCAVYNYTIPNLYGYAYFEKGSIKRIKHGEHMEVWVDRGDRLPFEEHDTPVSEMCDQLVQLVTGEELSELLGKEVRMCRFELRIDP